jgi:hypothetical protein
MSDQGDVWVRGVALMEALLKDDVLIGRLIKNRAYDDLYAMARIIHDDVDPRLALTNPALYRSLREAVTRAHLKGYGGLDLDRIANLREGKPAGAKRPKKKS